MGLTNCYITLAEFKSWTGFADTIDDSILEDVINSACRRIDNHCGRYFYQDSSTSTRVYYPNGDYLCTVDDISTSTGFAIATDTADDGTYDTTWTSSDYQLEPLNGKVDGLTGFPYWTIRAVGSYTFPVNTKRASVQITAKWGWAAVPDQVKNAAYMQSLRLYRRRTTPEGVMGGGGFGAIRVSRYLDPDVADLLGPFRHPAFAPGLAVA